MGLWVFCLIPFSIGCPWAVHCSVKGQSCRVLLPQSPLDTQSGNEPSTVAAKAGYLLWETKWTSCHANPTVPQIVCYRQSYFQMRLFLNASPLESCYLQNPCITFPHGCVCCITGFKNRNSVSKCQRKQKIILSLFSPCCSHRDVELSLRRCQLTFQPHPAIWTCMKCLQQHQIILCTKYKIRIKLQRN